MLGKESRWCRFGDEIADSVSIKDDITSVDAGLTITWFDVIRLTSRGETRGRERLRRACFGEGLEAVLAEVLSGIMGPGDESNMANLVKGTAGSAHVDCNGGWWSSCPASCGRLIVDGNTVNGGRSGWKVFRGRSFPKLPLKADF